MNPIDWFKRRGALSDESVQALRTAAGEAQRSRLPQMAAALSYRTIFGLLPVIVVALLLVNRFTPHEDRALIIERAVEYVGLQDITVPANFVPEPQRRQNAGLPEKRREAEPEPEQWGPPKPPVHIGEFVSGLVARASGTRSLDAVGLIGLLTLVYAAISMLVEIERAFNQIFRVPRGRSWYRHVVNYWTLLTLGGIGLALTFYIGAKFQAAAQHLVESGGFGSRAAPLTVGFIGYTITVIISTAMLSLAYATVPNTRVKPLAAILGGFIAAVLWEAGKWGFGQYIVYSNGYARIYGSLALAPLFMLWVYYTWLIVLFGLAVTYQFQYGRLKSRPQPLSDLGPTVVDSTAGLLIMTAMARAMSAGTPQSVKSLAQSTGLGEPVVSMVVARFAERGLLLRVERDGEGADALYTLARTPTSIRVGEVLALGFELAGGPESNPVVERMRKAQIDAAGSETLADIAGLPGGNPPKPATAPTPGTDKPVLVAQPVRP